jgi:hypothetical protein
MDNDTENKFFLKDENGEFYYARTSTSAGVKYIKIYKQLVDSDTQKIEAVNHPAHYNQVPGIECIDVVRYFSFNLGNSIKYIWRAGHKGDIIEDLEKAIWYLQDEIKRLNNEKKNR